MSDYRPAAVFLGIFLLNLVLWAALIGVMGWPLAAHVIAYAALGLFAFVLLHASLRYLRGLRHMQRIDRDLATRYRRRRVC
jgi:hypothetical protein